MLHYSPWWPDSYNVAPAAARHKCDTRHRRYRLLDTTHVSRRLRSTSTKLPRGERLVLVLNNIILCQPVTGSAAPDARYRLKEWEWGFLFDSGSYDSSNMKRYGQASGLQHGWTEPHPFDIQTDGRQNTRVLRTRAPFGTSNLDQSTECRPNQTETL